jgi:hypothetical protein
VERNGGAHEAQGGGSRRDLHSGDISSRSARKVRKAEEGRMQPFLALLLPLGAEVDGLLRNGKESLPGGPQIGQWIGQKD